MIDAILTNTLLPAISREMLTRWMNGGTIARVKVDIDNGEFKYDFD